MWIGSGKITLDFYNNSKLSEKKKVLENLCLDLRKLYNISILEVDEFEDLEKCVLGFAVVIPENWKTQTAKSFVEKICRTIDETSSVRVVSEEVELRALGSGDYELEERD